MAASGLAWAGDDANVIITPASPVRNALRMHQSCLVVASNTLRRIEWLRKIRPPGRIVQLDWDRPFQYVPRLCF
jgi:hypothetical protein